MSEFNGGTDSLILMPLTYNYAGHMKTEGNSIDDGIINDPFAFDSLGEEQMSDLESTPVQLKDKAPLKLKTITAVKTLEADCLGSIDLGGKTAGNSKKLKLKMTSLKKMSTEDEDTERR